MFHSRIDYWINHTFALVASVGGLILMLVLGFLLRESWPLLGHSGWSHLFFDRGWFPSDQLYGLSPMIWASLAASTGAIVLAAPVGVAFAIVIHFFAPPSLHHFLRLSLSLLAGIPSVVFGLWGLTVIVPIINQYEPPGASLLAATIILALMIVPTVGLTSLSAMKAVPSSIIQNAAALGLSMRATIVNIVLPASKGGIISGIVLAIARALGETMAVLMVAGNVVQAPTSLFASVRVLTANIALEMSYATGNHRAGLFASGLILSMVVIALALGSSTFLKKHRYA